MADESGEKLMGPTADIALVLSSVGHAPAWDADRLRAELELTGRSVVLVDDVSRLDAATRIVHCFGLECARRVAQTRPGLPLVLTPSSQDSAAPAGGQGDAVLAAEASAVVRSSRDRDHVHRLGVPWARTWVLPGAVDVGIYSRVGPMARRTARVRLIAEMHGPDDGLEDVLSALGRLDGVELVVLAQADGRPDRAREVRDAATASGVSQRVVLVQPESDGERAWWMRSAHAAVAVPHAPCRSDFAAQAMACGNAAMVTPVDGLADLVVPGVTGLTVPAGDPLSLARAVGSLIAHDFTLESQGIAAADRALARFAWPRVVAELVGIYRGVAGERAADPPVDARALVVVGRDDEGGGV